MLPTTYVFQYNPENLSVFSYTFDINNLLVPGIIFSIIALYAVLYFLAPYIYSFFLASEQQHAKEAKKNVIKDLILMKEVQGELEKEIEQSLLNITLQGKGA